MALAVVFGMLAPATAFADPTPSASPSPTPSQTPPQEPTPNPSPTPSPTPTKPGKPGKPGSDAKPGKPTETPADSSQPDKKKKRKKKKEPPTVDMAVVIAAAETQLATAKPDLLRATQALRTAKAARDASARALSNLKLEATVGKAVSVGDERQARLRGLASAVLPQVPSAVSLTLSGPPPGPQAGAGIDDADTADIQALIDSERAIVAAEGDLARAEAKVAEAQAAYDLVRLNVATARATLGLATGELTSQSVARQFADYPVGECSFPGVANPTDCRAAQQWAIAQTASPMKNWFNLCLNFVTIAYGWSSGAPTAIAMWNSLPQSRKHSPNTVAPPGALMFWGPNHVALSLGNNVLVSTDILGSGRAWIVTFETFQSLWKMQYLGWSEPDFRIG